MGTFDGTELIEFSHDSSVRQDESFRQWKERVEDRRVINIDMDKVRALINNPPKPTGNGRIVLGEAIVSVWPISEDLAITLLERAQMGRAKYGTYLRTHNSRNALQDALDEALDGYMYATQLDMEAPSYDVEELRRMFLEAAQLCRTMINKTK